MWADFEKEQLEKRWNAAKITNEHAERELEAARERVKNLWIENGRLREAAHRAPEVIEKIVEKAVVPPEVEERLNDTRKRLEETAAEKMKLEAEIERMRTAGNSYDEMNKKYEALVSAYEKLSAKFDEDAGKTPQLTEGARMWLKKRAAERGISEIETIQELIDAERLKEGA